MKEVETDKLLVRLREDGIMHVHIKARVTVDIELQEEMLRIYDSMINGLHPFIFSAGEFLAITREAQKNAKKIEDQSPVGASALIVKGVAQKLIADFYYKIDPPKRPLKVFREIDKGVEWLKTLDCYKNLQ
ncbi:MAG: hypothetical protein KDC84_15835 [Crocinitomicaceae bacterium]|nr:hypothetical protein [Crocinitomicaceae bacterium]